MIDTISSNNRNNYEKLLAEYKAKEEAFRKETEEIIHTLEDYNPLYSIHKCKSIKEFGEKWSENFIKSQVPNLHGDDNGIENGAGYDAFGIHYNKIEIKSSKLDYIKDKWSMNQLHLEEADAFIFVWYNVDNGTYRICFMPTEDIKKYLKPSHQHNEKDKNEGACYIFKNAIYRRKIMDKYMISSMEELNEKV